MILTRRRALLGLLAAPVIIRTPGLLMPVRKVVPSRWTVGRIIGANMPGIGIDNRDYEIWAIASADGGIDFGFTAV